MGHLESTIPAEPLTNRLDVNLAEKRLGELIKPAEEAILSTLPAIHRVQKAFGKAEFLPINRLTINAAYDLESFGGVTEIESLETTQHAIATLQQAELIFYELFAPKIAERLERIGDSVKELDGSRIADKIITRSLWRHWKPYIVGHKFNPQLGITDSLITVVMGNVGYAYETLFRDSKKTVSYNHSEEGDKNDTDGLDGDFRTFRNRFKGYTPSAEEIVLRKETLEEFTILASGRTLFNFATGLKEVELAHQRGIPVNALKRELATQMSEVIAAGRAQFDWTDQEAELLVEFIFGGNKQKKGIIGYPDMWTMFQSLDLAHLMGFAEQLEPLTRKLFLHRIGYLDDEKKLNQEDWLKRENIDVGTYGRRINEALLYIEQRIAEPPRPTQSIKSIVESAQNPTLLRLSSGRLVDKEESYAVTIISELKQFGPFPHQSLTRAEGLVVSRLKEYYDKNKTIPTVAELETITGLIDPQIRYAMKTIANVDRSEVRYATREFPLRKSSSWYKLVKWYKENKNTQQELAVLSLTTTQLVLFNIAVATQSSYLPSTEDIRTKLKEIEGKEGAVYILDISHTFEDMLKRIQKAKVGKILELYEILKTRDFSSDKEMDLIAKSLLQRIEQRKAVGQGSIYELARELGMNEARVKRVVYKILEAK